MVRPSNPKPASTGDEIINTEAVAASFALAHLPQARQQAQELATLFQYPGALTVDAVEYHCREGMRRSVESTLQLGAALCILKAMTAHGDFIERVERMGLHERAARRFMSAAMRFAKSDKKSVLLGAGNQAKLLELIAVDDDVIDDLEQAGQLDQIDTMTASELRATLREAQAEKEAGDHLLEKKNKKIDALERKLKHFDRAPPSERLAELQAAATSVANEATGLIAGTLRQAVIALQNFGDERHTHDHFLAGLAGQVQAALSGLRQEFNLPDISEAESDLQAGARQAIRAARQAGSTR